MSSWIPSYIQYIESLLTNDIKLYAERKIKLRLPKLSTKMLIDLGTEACNILESEPTVLHTDTKNGSIIIVGDIHGHLLDLFSIFRKFGSPRNQRYLFMGDLVDRGEFSIETAVLVLAIKVCFPENALFIRGNHEFSSMYNVNGFGNDLQTEYSDGNTLNILFDTVFSYLPLVCIINNKYFCVHGGISPNISNISEIERISKPINDNNCDTNVSDLLWSDPSEAIPFFMPSSRGIGFLYGIKSIEKFFKENGLKKIIRAHQCVKEGIQHNLYEGVITVFSASNYCGVSFNKGGVLIINEDQLQEYTYGPLPYLKRQSVIFINNESDTEFILPSRKDVLAKHEIRHPPLSIPEPEKRERLPLMHIKGTSSNRNTSLSISKKMMMPYMLSNRACPKSGVSLKPPLGCDQRIKLRQSSSIKSIPRPGMFRY